MHGMAVLCTHTETPPKSWCVLSQAEKQPTCRFYPPQHPWHCDKEESEAQGSSGEDGDAPGGTHANAPPSGDGHPQALAGGNTAPLPPTTPASLFPPFYGTSKAGQHLPGGVVGSRGRERLCWSSAAMNYSERDDNYRSPLVLLALCRQEQDSCRGEGLGAGRVPGTETITGPISLGPSHHGVPQRARRGLRAS